MRLQNSYVAHKKGKIPAPKTQTSVLEAQSGTICREVVDVVVIVVVVVVTVDVDTIDCLVLVLVARFLSHFNGFLIIVAVKDPSKVSPVREGENPSACPDRKKSNNSTTDTRCDWCFVLLLLLSIRKIVLLLVILLVVSYCRLGKVCPLLFFL